MEEGREGRKKLALWEHTCAWSETMPTPSRNSPLSLPPSFPPSFLPYQVEQQPSSLQQAWQETCLLVSEEKEGKGYVQLQGGREGGREGGKGGGRKDD